MRRILPHFAIAASSLLLTGCMQIGYSVSVDDDGSGTLDAAIDIDVESLAELQSSFGSFDGSEGATPAMSNTEMCAEALSDTDTNDLPPNATVTEINDGTRCALEISAAFAAGEADTVLSDVFDDSATLERSDDGGWRFELGSDLFGSLTGSTMSAGEDTAGGDMPSAGDEMLDGFAAMFFEDITFALRVELPGKVVEHNGTEEDGAVTWTYTLNDVPNEPLMVRTSPESGPSLPVMFLAGGVGLLAVAGGGLWWQRRVKAAAATGTNEVIYSSAGHDGTHLADSAAPSQPEGWYDDPYNAARLRWWDGSTWTEHTSD